MSFIEGIVYGFVSGFTEFLPVSSQGHQALLFELFGLTGREPLRDLFVHIAVLLSLLTSCKQLISHMHREQLLLTRRSKRRNSDRRGQYDLRLIKAAGFLLTGGMFFYFITRKFEFQLPYLILFFAVNGVILIIPEYMRHGNKDARFMTGGDGVMLGLLGACSVFPGLSRTGIMSSYAVARGADRQHALNWIFVLGIPALAVYMVTDVVSLFTVGAGIQGFIGVLSCITTGIVAYLGGCFGIMFVRFLTVKTGFAGFAYYSWGTALLTFVLYLIV